MAVEALVVVAVDLAVVPLVAAFRREAVADLAEEAVSVEVVAVDAAAVALVVAAVDVAAVVEVAFKITSYSIDGSKLS